MVSKNMGKCNLLSSPFEFLNCLTFEAKILTLPDLVLNVCQENI